MQQIDKNDEANLDRAIADSFPASDPPSQTSPITATPSQAQVPLGHLGGVIGDDIRLYRVIEPRHASQPFSGSGSDGGGRWTTPRTSAVYASLSPATARRSPFPRPSPGRSGASAAAGGPASR